MYKTCANCHGINGDSPALGKSAVINLMNEEQISRALNGYLDGSYSGELKIVMKVEAQKLTKEEM
ncbi:c-type cytochrome [Campylobacter sputorum]